MALGLLWLGLLLGDLSVQALDSIPGMTEIPPLDKFPLQPDFQEHQFQGRWYAIGLAQHTFKNKCLRQPAMYMITYELKDDSSYNATYTWVSDQGCDHKSDPMVPSDQPGQFILDNITRSEKYTMRVLATDYNQTAIVLRVSILKNRVYFENILYGRTMELSPEMEMQYIEVSKSLGFSDDHITITAPMADGHLAERHKVPSYCIKSYHAREQSRISLLQCNDPKPSPPKPRRRR
ncbi:neutrophil gelatinase-associated lipocalin-like [Heterocephalus glaber]|uniref:Neutrophil gelatinase-associated lipocalin-like n=1 Tax=Heterocephalus glaber TaxID=10181 RepID=A0AAX6T5T5_HETGA|nr:neutrophil gelatinase-associated lipocalin-like [Heterocephalus glaber]